jgi:hypothetical protein
MSTSGKRARPLDDVCMDIFCAVRGELLDSCCITSENQQNNFGRYFENVFD